MHYICIAMRCASARRLAELSIAQLAMVAPHPPLLPKPQSAVLVRGTPTAKPKMATNPENLGDASLGAALGELGSVPRPSPRGGRDGLLGTSGCVDSDHGTSNNLQNTE